MSVVHQQRVHVNRAHKRQSLRQERTTLMQMLQERTPYAQAMLTLSRRGLFGRLKWALFKR